MEGNEFDMTRRWEIER